MNQILYIRDSSDEVLQAIAKVGVPEWAVRSRTDLHSTPKGLGGFACYYGLILFGLYFMLVLAMLLSFSWMNFQFT